jgi:hypothetical protein
LGFLQAIHQALHEQKILFDRESSTIRAANGVQQKREEKSGMERIEGKIEHNMSMKKQYPCQKGTQTIILTEEASKP